MTETIRELKVLIPQIRACAFGHVGDGNIHFNLSRPVDMTDDSFYELEEKIHKIVYDRSVSMVVSISAEHGIGRLRKNDLKTYNLMLNKLIITIFKDNVFYYECS